MDPTILIIMVVLGALIFFFFSNRGSKRAGGLRCTRCDGTGEVNENWPDPAEEGGWHRVSGTCPKCKGKGRV